MMRSRSFAMLGLAKVGEGANTLERNRIPGVTLIALWFVMLVSACGEPAVTRSSTAHPTTNGQAQLAADCAAFDSRIWAQTVLDDDPTGESALDPDGDGLACEDLPLGAAPAVWTETIPAAALPVTLASVTDGDTIEVVVNGRLEAVRLVGVDAPEAGGPHRDVECFGLEGTAFLEWLMATGGDVFIEKDREEEDRYGRLLRWVWLDRGQGEVYLLNEALIRAGFAERFRDTPNRRYVDELIAAEDFAQRYALGLWRGCDV